DLLLHSGKLRLDELQLLLPFREIGHALTEDIELSLQRSRQFGREVRLRELRFDPLRFLGQASLRLGSQLALLLQAQDPLPREKELEEDPDEPGETFRMALEERSLVGPPARVRLQHLFAGPLEALQAVPRLLAQTPHLRFRLGALPLELRERGLTVHHPLEPGVVRHREEIAELESQS